MRHVNSSKRDNISLILLYHHVAPAAVIENRVDRKLYVSSEDFEKQVSFLSNNFNVLSMDELVDSLSCDRNMEKPGVVIGFDDGHADNYHHAYPIRKSAPPML